MPAAGVRAFSWGSEPAKEEAFYSPKPSGLAKLQGSRCHGGPKVRLLPLPLASKDWPQLRGSGMGGSAQAEAGFKSFHMQSQP